MIGERIALLRHGSPIDKSPPRRDLKCINLFIAFFLFFLNFVNNQ